MRGYKVEVVWIVWQKCFYVIDNIARTWKHCYILAYTEKIILESRS